VDCSRHGLLTEQEREENREALQATVASATVEGYVIFWSEWLVYLRSRLDPVLVNDPFLQHLKDTPKDQAARLVHFCAWSRGQPGYTKERVCKALSALRFFFTASSYSPECFEAESLKKMRKGPKVEPNELRAALLLKLQTATLPAFPAMIRDMREELFATADVSTARGLDCQSIYCGCALGMDKGHRVGHFTLKDGKKADHCMRANTVVVTFRDGVVLTVGQELHEYLEINPDWQGVSIQFNQASSKTVGKDGSIRCRSLPEAQLVNDLISFWHAARTQGNDEIFTRYHGGYRKVLRRSDVNQTLKQFANRAEMPGDRFSSKSLRLGANVSLKLAGVPAEERNENNGWAPGSTVPARHYDAPLESLVPTTERQSLARGVFATLRPDGSGELTVQRMGELIKGKGPQPR
jgi:hypothetical protein